jgi:hypothetical protein
MKLLLFLIALLINSGTIFAQTSTLEDFIETQGNGDDATSLYIPGWVIQSGVYFAAEEDAATNQELESLRPLINGISSLRFTMLKNSEAVAQGTVARFVQKLRKRQYEPLIKVKSDGSTVHILMRTEERDAQTKVCRLLLVIQDGDEVVLCSISGSWKMGTIKRLLQEQDIGKLLDRA